jgi:putative ABC transport system permease protein
VSIDYLDVLGAPLVQGRAFARGDTATDPTRGTPLIVSRSWAKHYFPDGSAIGRRVISGGCVTCPPNVIVGVVGDVKYMGLGGTGDAVYEPVPLGLQREANLFVRTSAPPSEVVAHVVGALRSVDPGVPLEDAAPMAERVYASVAQPRHVASLLGAFAIAAIVLAAIGIFGMLSYTVSARRREIGVRMALGARPGAVTAMIVRRGMTHALAGALLGLAIALAATRWLSGLLYAVGASDPATLVATTALLLAVALVACWLPARRAASIDPVRAIRID